MLAAAAAEAAATRERHRVARNAAVVRAVSLHMAAAAAAAAEVDAAAAAREAAERAVWQCGAISAALGGLREDDDGLTAVAGALEASALREALEQSEGERRVVEEQRAAMAAQLHMHSERAALEAAAAAAAAAQSATAEGELQVAQRQLCERRSSASELGHMNAFVTAPSSPELPASPLSLSPARTRTHSAYGEVRSSGVDEHDVLMTSMEHLLRLHVEVETDTQEGVPPSRSTSLPSPSPSRERSPPSSPSSPSSSPACAPPALASVVARLPASSSSSSPRDVMAELVTFKGLVAMVSAERDRLRAQLDSKDAALLNPPQDRQDRDKNRGDSAREHDAPAQSTAALAGKWKAMGDELLAAKLALQREAKVAEAARAALTTKEAEREAAVLRMLTAQGAAQAAGLETQAATAAVAQVTRVAAKQQAAAEAKVQFFFILTSALTLPLMLPCRPTYMAFGAQRTVRR